MIRRDSIYPAIAIFIGGLVAVLGTYWDDAWHTIRGRDDFAIPPHLMLYAGVTFIGMAVVYWAYSAFRSHKNLSAVVRHPPLALAMIGDATTLLAAPIDNAWHVAFGRDAVLWSPPHMLGIVGLLTVGGGILLRMSQVPSRFGHFLTIAGSAFTLGVLLVPVMEYESDVPQFATVWYLPVLTAGAAFAFSLSRVVSPQHWIVPGAAALYTVMRIGVAVFLAAVGLSEAFVFIPPIVVPALVFQLAAQARWPRIVCAALLSLAVYASYVPYLNYMLDGISFTLIDILAGLPLATATSWLVFAMLAPSRSRLRPPLMVILLMGIFFMFVPHRAFAHDPGQGEEVGQAALVVVQGHFTATLTAEVIRPLPCDHLSPNGVVARRAGQTLRAPLRRIAACRFQGELKLAGRGRWFMYIELVDQGQIREAWLPMMAGESNTRSEKLAPIYITNGSTASWIQIVSGVGLYAIDLVLLVAIVIVFRRAQARGEVHGTFKAEVSDH